MIRIIFIVLLIISNQTFAKSKCQKEWDSLKSIQALMRQRSTEYYRQEEHKRHDIYQNCRKKKNNNQVKEKKSYTTKNKKNYITNKSYTGKQASYTRDIHLKGLFTGKKQDAWIQHYERPKECINPKSTPEFATCLQHRDDEAIRFGDKWRNNNAPPSIKLGTH
ncbi:MAG: hypothetical protein MJK12_03835 [Colwellia sp.]|nr:hypothetical protein [Colwellia sp.]